MKTEWICRWQSVPGHEKYVETYSTLSAARQAMAKVLTDAVDLRGYIQALRQEDGADCGSSADFLEKFLSDLTIPESDAEIPDHLDIPDHCLLEIYSDDGFRWDYRLGECPSLRVSHPYYGNDGHPFIIDFAYEDPAEIKPNRVNSVCIQIDEHINYGTSAYPLMVWSVLCEKPQTQEQIVKSIRVEFKTVIDRKAVGRHLRLLGDLGFPVQKSAEGYYCGEENCEPQTHRKYTPSAYPLLILRVLDDTPKTKTAIIQAVQEQFGAKIDRKAVGRHLELLDAFGYHIQKCDGGYTIGK